MRLYMCLCSGWVCAYYKCYARLFVCIMLGRIYRNTLPLFGKILCETIFDISDSLTPPHPSWYILLHWNKTIRSLESCSFLIDRHLEERLKDACTEKPMYYYVSRFLIYFFPVTWVLLTSFSNYPIISGEWIALTERFRIHVYCCLKPTDSNINSA